MLLKRRVGLTTIRSEYKDKPKQFDLKRFFYITDQGKEYLKLRGEIMQETTEAQLTKQINEPDG